MPLRSQTDDWWRPTACVRRTYWQQSEETLTSASFFWFIVQHRRPEQCVGECGVDAHIHILYERQRRPDVAPSESENAKRISKTDSCGWEGSGDVPNLWENHREEDIAHQFTEM